MNLKEELFACFKYIGIPLNILDKMPVRDRKFYIHRYNKYMEEKERAMKDSGGGFTTEDIEGYTDQSQGY